MKKAKRKKVGITKMRRKGKRRKRMMRRISRIRRTNKVECA